ncbi:MAG: hypothetical protein AAF404_19580 [Pseudomonadota bacterium]
MDPLDRKLSDYYQQRTLNSARLESILAESQRHQQRRKLPLYAAAAGILMMLVGVLHQHALSNQQVDYAMREAALNHLNKLKLDAEAGSIADLQNGLEELPFEMVLPEGKIYEELALIGGRYCTIGGNLAAHLKFAHPKSGELLSLFMTPRARTTESLVSDPAHVEGIEVTLWQENDVVYAMARSPEQVQFWK